MNRAVPGRVARGLAVLALAAVCGWAFNGWLQPRNVALWLQGWMPGFCS